MGTYGTFHDGVVFLIRRGWPNWDVWNGDGVTGHTTIARLKGDFNPPIVIEKGSCSLNSFLNLLNDLEAEAYKPGSTAKNDL